MNTQDNEHNDDNLNGQPRWFHGIVWMLFSVLAIVTLAIDKCRRQDK